MTGVEIAYTSGQIDDAVVRHGVLRQGMPVLQKPFTVASLAANTRESLLTPAD